MIEGFARATTNLILLTATPEQLGRTGHFARLRLLDAARYGDLERFQHEAESYAQLSQIVEKLQEGAPLSDAEQIRIATMLRMPFRCSHATIPTRGASCCGGSSTATARAA